jgi:ADP-ribose pyrophosphatase YjhB (NUDIX family)
MDVKLQEKLSEAGSNEKCPVVVLMRDGKILTGHRHYTKDKWKDISVWTIPGGRCDTGETLEQTLRRETQEETGIDSYFTGKAFDHNPLKIFLKLSTKT